MRFCISCFAFVCIVCIQGLLLSDWLYEGVKLVALVSVLLVSAEVVVKVAMSAVTRGLQK